MPSRKFSVNSQNSAYSQKTSRSNSNEAVCHKTASVYQIGELYAALTELIHSSPAGRDRTTRTSLVRTKSLWSSENNLLENKTTLSPRTSSETPHLRPARSASCLSSKSCYAAIGSKTTNVAASVASRNTDTSKTGGICSKIVAKLRGKKLGEQSKSTEHRRATSEGQARNGYSKIHTIDDLLEMTKLNSNANGKTNSKDKRRKVKALGRKKAHSFDSCETETSTICVHKVSSKLKTWYTRAASYAATMEDEDYSRAGSSCCTGSTENFLESSGYGSKGETANLEEKEHEKHVVRDFDVSSNDALDEPQNRNIVDQIVAKKPCPVKRLERRAFSDLTSKTSPFSLDKSYRTSESNDGTFDIEKINGTKELSHTVWNSETRCDLIRRLSLNIVEDVLAGKSASCTQIGSGHLSRDLSKRKVQQWLKNLHADGKEKDSVGCKERAEIVSPNDAVDGKITSEKIVQHSPVSTTLVKRGSEYVEEHSSPSRGRGLSAEALFYIPNIEQTEQRPSVNMILNF